MTVAPLIAMKSTKCESLEAVGKELDRRAHTYANDVDQSGRHVGYLCRAGDESPVPLEQAIERRMGELNTKRKPCRRAAATTPPTSGAISASFRLPKLGGGLPDTEAIPHGITAPPGMCAMTQTAPRSCWRRGRASTTGCPTVVRTMGVRGGKRKNGEGQKPSPFR